MDSRERRRLATQVGTLAKRKKDRTNAQAIRAMDRVKDLTESTLDLAIQFTSLVQRYAVAKQMQPWEVLAWFESLVEEAEAGASPPRAGAR